MSAIQIRDVPAAVSRILKAKAATAGVSLSDYLRGELEQLAARPSRAELLARLASRPVVEVTPAADVLATERSAQ